MDLIFNENWKNVGVELWEISDILFSEPNSDGEQQLFWKHFTFNKKMHDLIFS